VPASSGAEAGIRQTIAALRVQRRGFSFAGVNKQVPASEIDDGQLQEGTNVRVVGGRLDNRGGQSKMSNTTVTGSPLGIFDDWQGSI